MVSFPGQLPVGSRKARSRKQKMFAKREEAEAFLALKRREYLQGKRTILWDAEQHMDALRALEILSDVPGASLEKGAMMLRLSRSRWERRGGGYEAPAASDRRVELSPRVYLAVANEAERRGVSIWQACEGIILGWLEAEARAGIRKRQLEEQKEYEALKERNGLDRKMVREHRERERLKEELGAIGVKYEMWKIGEEVQREARNMYERERRRRKRELERQSAEAKQWK
jgi:hypothetical protein